MTADVHAVSRRLAELGVPDGAPRHAMLTLVQLWVLTWTVAPAFDAPIVADEAGPRVPAIEDNGSEPTHDAEVAQLEPELEAMVVSVVVFYRDAQRVPDEVQGAASPWRAVRAAGEQTAGLGPPEISMERLRSFGVQRASYSEVAVPARPALPTSPRPSAAAREALIARLADEWRETLDDLADR